ncbi:DUF1294 domain-containing protein [Acidovorax sp. RAC01]|uniref:DUF1294 domain-containing protein n=1 Tax=Acidovorax sp. RAC01 TaxID=1842533 RepID=UPI00083E7C6B|nr:cold shock and DUF1294 domain-containing protein [Acidovorax sp. RAC01]AOG22683.1 Cold-shock DNA-binding domain protein [Acidovorax sp. RAC01]
MQKQGTVTRWDTARGFGFIRSPDTPADVFFHVRDFRGAEPPREGLRVVFEEIHVGGKGPRAMAVQTAGGAGATGNAAQRTGSAANPPPSAGGARNPGANPRRSGNAPQRDAPAARSQQEAPRTKATARGGRPSPASAASAGVALLLTILWLGLIAWGIWAGRLPLGWTLGAALGLNALTFAAYAIDKNAAMQRQWRIPEKHLHLLSLAGGWPGAWLAQQLLRHKSQKAEFRLAYWGTVVLHNAALAAWMAGVIHLP